MDTESSKRTWIIFDCGNVQVDLCSISHGIHPLKHALYEALKACSLFCDSRAKNSANWKLNKRWSFSKSKHVCFTFLTLFPVLFYRFLTYFGLFDEFRQASITKMSLSKNVLGMKFMQRTKQKIELKEEEEKSSHLLSQECIKQFAASSSQLDRIVTVDSFVPCEDLLFGRMSFKGANPEIERLMIGFKSPGQEEKEEAEVTAVEMTSRYEKMAVGDVERNPQVKRKRTKYIRPVDDS